MVHFLLSGTNWDDIGYFLELALIGIVTVLFCGLLLRGDYSENKYKGTVSFQFA